MDILAVACALVATALYCNTLQAGFVYDDRRAILTNPDLLASTPWYRLFENDFWGTPLTERGSHGSYRPLCVATFRLNHFLGGLEPWGYHLVNVALHAACTVLVVKVARKVLPGRSNLAHAITGFLFAVHPIHSEAVAGIVGRADLLACFLTLTSFLTYSAHCNRTRRSFPLLLALVSSTLATLAKETGISSLALCLLWELCRGEPSRKGNCSAFTRGRSVGILSGGLALLALGRLKLAGNRPEFASADNPTARHPSRLTRSLTFLYLPAASARMLLCPSTLSFDWSMDAVPRITSPLDLRNLESVCLYTVLIGAAFWAVRGLRRPCRKSTMNLFQQTYPRSASSRCPVCAGRRTGGCHTDGCRAANNNNNSPLGDCHCAKRPNSNVSVNGVNIGGRQTAATAVAVSLGFLVLPFLPASNLFFYVGFVIAERVLYLPSVGACLAVGAAISGCYRIARRNGSRTRGRAVLLGTAILIGMLSAKTLVRNTDWRDEESLYRSALHVNPPKAYGNLGSILSEQGRVAEAEEAFVQALRYRPNMADVHYNLGILQQGRKNYDEAILSYQRAIHFRPSLAQAYVNLGAALISVGRGTDAAAVLRAGASLDGSGLKDKRAHEAARVQALLQLGALYADQGRLQRALSAYREALRALPDHYPPQSVYNLLGETLSRLQQYAEAERWFQASLASQPDHVPAHITYGKLLARNSSRVLEAERWFLRARRLAPDDPSVHHHYGLFLTSQGRLVEAAEEQLRAAELLRSDYELSVAAASALRQADRRDEAEIWYRHAASLRPHEARSHTNLGAILHLNGKYKQAAAAYKEALRLQPGDATTITNLHKLAAILA
ncbi:PREDICTED: transmembrane and TPR repeat-containing protein CG4341-like isoform X1 [Cyphomyrmex costatus]|uniref:transmembrane and TPR repeat-containing protein CG4341-like isoform X1 n=1 Tax=Cyphomyrmex costatus TaxID=456900 RepID=UPI00085231C2|nr:PREDICTED: transmembrane and TPR repeat-containing protein CG4341-like isoform X1 [Cyphomyrmex costatus]